MAWDPWRELERREHIAFARCPLPEATGGGVYVRWPNGRAGVLVDGSRPCVEQTVALAHELVHDERGGACPCPDGAPEGWTQVARQEEARVARLVAERLVPADDLASHVERVTGLDEAVTTAGVAEEFGTTERAARLALLELWRTKRREIELRRLDERSGGGCSLQLPPGTVDD